MRIIRGPSAGSSGTVFWSGPSKRGPGLRVGVTVDGGEKVWVAGADIEAAGAAAGGRGGERAHPFRFYGRSPSDWIEGASGGHAFSVQFVAPPGEDALARIAELYAAAFEKGDAQAARAPWEWSGRFAHFEVGERGGAHRDARFLAPVTEFLREVHRIAPIRDVVYLNAREGLGEWDRWSVAQAQSPDPGPAGWAYQGLFRRAVDGALPALAASPLFEQVRERAENASWAARDIADMDSAVAKGRSGKGLRIVRHDGEGPRPPVWPAADLALFQRPPSRYLPGDHLDRWVWERPLAWVVEKPDGPRAGLAWIEDGARRTAQLPPEMGWGQLNHFAGLRDAAVHPDGSRMLVCCHKHLVEVTFATGAVSQLPHPSRAEDLQSVAYLQHGRCSALTRNHLFVLAPPADGGRLLARVKGGGQRLVPVLGGAGLLVVGDENTTLHAIDGERPASVGTVKASIGFARVHEGRLLVTPGRLSDRWYELAGALEALTSASARRASKKPAQGKSRPKR